MSIEDIARPAVRRLKSYVASPQDGDAVRLNANENPDSDSGLNRYPEVRPVALTRHLAAHFGVASEQLLATRGSTEALDLLIRSFCREGIDNIVLTPPTFEMYRVYADIQGARVIEVPLDPQKNFELDVNALLEACDAESRIVLICTPNNPTGAVTSREQIEAVLEARRDQSVVVVDEAYIEFSDRRSVVDLIPRFDNLVVLRTLSKALALAGLRCGAVMASPAMIKLLDSVLAPYALCQPVIDTVLQALSPDRIVLAAKDIEGIVAERVRFAKALAASREVDKVWPSQANFLLVRFHEIRHAQSLLIPAGVLIRDFGPDTRLKNCARITVGTRSENDRLLEVLV